ncbi:MAG: UDP-3-O-acylglucosamine N-acyltransferase [bacterium]|nr:UDP-3-O-(3-hydroxymyristoyl)glucosamine N-acyltransferase [Candidatus Omnitrophota bacterium]MBV6481277.1 UDP-3-O-acylglucosamine N-acyltransferase [bacterium]
MPTLRLGELAERIACKLVGDPNVLISGVNTIDAAGPGELSFVHNEKYISAIPNSRASAIVVPMDLETEFRPLLRSADPYVTFGEAMRIFLPKRQRPEPGSHPTAMIHPTARIDPTASIGPFCCIEEGVHIGPEVTVMAGCQIGQGTFIGAGSWIYPNVVIGAAVRTGQDVIVHSGTVLISPVCEVIAENENAGRKFLTEIGKDVEIGASVTVEPGRNHPTRIGPGTKLDNLVRIGAEARIGDDCIIVAQVSIGAGVTIGNNVTLAGQVCIEPHRRVGDEVMVGAKSLISDEVEDRAVVSGIPALRHDQDLRLKAHLRRLPKLFQRVEALERSLQYPSDEPS